MQSPTMQESEKAKVTSSVAARDWSELYAIYGVACTPAVAFLLLHSLLGLALSAIISLHLPPSPPPLLPLSAAAAAISSLLLLSAAAHLLHSSLPLHWRMCQRIVDAVPDWPGVRTALDLGCSRRGLLLNSVALHLRRLRIPARVVGLHPRRRGAVRALRASSLEGVQDLVTCREGDCRHLPFADGCFDVVVSAVYLSGEEERGKALGEVARVLRAGGVGVMWDLAHVPEFVKRLRELGMEDIRVSERVTAYLAASHIVSFRKPRETSPPSDWRVDVFGRGFSG